VAEVKGTPALQHRLGRAKTLIISGPGDVLILEGKQVVSQLTSRETASLVQLWQEYREGVDSGDSGG
jgi:hypothetical protein